MLFGDWSRWDEKKKEMTSDVIKSSCPNFFLVLGWGVDVQPFAQRITNARNLVPRWTTKHPPRIIRLIFVRLVRCDSINRYLSLFLCD